MNNGYYWCKHPEGTQFIALFFDHHWWVPGLENPVLIDPLHVLWPVAQPGVFGSPAVAVDRRIN